MNRPLPFFLLLPVLALAFAATAPAAPTAVSWGLHDPVTLDSAAPGTPSDPAAPAATVSLSADGAETRVLAHLPAAVFEADTNLLTRAELSLDFRAAAWNPSRPLVLHALTNAYDPAAATWTDRASGTPWRTPGGDPVARYCVTAAVVSVTSGLWRATWNLRPMLWRASTCQNLAANGLLLRMGGSRPSAGTLAAPFEPAGADLYLVWQDPFLSTHDYAISGISNGPFHKEYATNATDETVWWEQDITTVGRVMLQTNGFESRAILCMPRELRTLDPDRIQRIEGHFEAYINTWSGERISLHPVTTPTRLEMAGNRPYNGANPAHGPSWRWADGPVDTNDAAYPRLPWTTPGGDFDETVSADATLAKLSQYVDSVLFDLTPLWRDARVRDLLLSNGAIIKADRATWSGTNLCAVQIYCSDGYTQTYKGADSTFRITEYPSLPGAAAALAPDAFFYLDAWSPDWKSLGTARVWVLRNRDPSKGDTHGLLHFPDALAARDPALLESATLRFRAEYNADAASPAPIHLHPLLEPFGHATLAEAATWNHAYTGGPAGTVPWTLPGGPFGAVCATGTWDRAGQELAFDLAPLLADPAAAAAAAAAAANGLLLRIDPDWDAFGDATFVRYNIQTDTAALHLRDRPLAIALLRSDTPDTPARPPTTLSLALAPDAETRAVLRFGDAAFTQDPRQIADIRLFLTTPSPLPEDCTLLLAPLSTPVRLGEATWTRATRTTPWTTPGGDIHPGAPSIPAVPSAGATGCYFDLAPILRDPAAAAALRANGALLRLVRTSPGTSGDTPSPVTWTASGPDADPPSARPVPLAIPATPAIASLTLADGHITLATVGLDPARDYLLESSPTLPVPPAGWTPEHPIPRTGELTILPPSTVPAVFYRIRAAD